MQNRNPLPRLLGVLLLASSAAAQAGTVDTLQTLQAQGQAQQAYQLGLAHPEELGNPAFDLQYGIACLDAGHASEGIFALQRFLLNFPEHARARLELARGYFALGEDVIAREEFEAVAKLNPPPAVQAAIERYIEAIRAREGRYKSTAAFYLESGIGRDSNINGGVSAPNINLPVLGNVTLSDTGVATADNFAHLAAGGQIATPITPSMTLSGGLNYDNRLYRSSNAFDIGSLSANGGVALREENDLFRLNTNASTMTVAHAHYRDVFGLSGEWLHQLDDSQGVNLALQYARLSYVDSNAVRDALLLGSSLGYRKILPLAWQPVLSAGLNYSQERNQRDRADLGRNISGATLGISVSPHPQWGISLDASYANSLYNGADLVMSSTRQDSNRAVSLSATYLWTKAFSLRSELSASSNQSNLELYNYNRTSANFNLRYTFK